MAEMEKEGRPPESKRSRKPAHPVKREINEEMKSFAESTMNELLGWYGYDKVELRDSDSLETGETPQHISVLRENSLPKMPASTESREGSPDRANSSHSAPGARNGVTEPSTSLPVMAPMIPPPLLKAPADDDGSSIQIMCAWCQKVGVKRYSLSMGSELKSFCSEKCFAACRRAYFKRNKARDEDGPGGILPQQSYTQDTPRVVFKTNSDVLVCDWCKHIRHTKEYLDFGAGERRLQFCSAKCLNQYKMDIFYKETQAALPPGLCNPGHGAGGMGDGKAESGGGVQLLTPESWGSPLTDLRRKVPSPGAPSATSPSEPVCSPSSSSSTKVPTPRPHESPALPHPHPHPPPPMPPLHAPMGVPPGSPPMVMTPRGPMPLPLFMEHHQMMQQIRPPFLRPSPHGPSSPLSNPMIPGIGPPPPPRTLGPPPSSPMHRPMMSPHMHPSASNPNPGMMPPHPGLPMPGMPPFPPVNMMPNGPVPMPPMMNFGMPSLAPLVPPPTLLVPYPVIVPLPVPIPIPIPIPFSPRASRDRPDSSGPIPSATETSEPSDPSGFPRSFFPGGWSGGDGGDRRAGGSLSPRCSAARSPGQAGSDSERSRAAPVDSTVKAEDGVRGVIDLTVGQRSCQQQVIQRALPGVQVKVEPEVDSSPVPAAVQGTRDVRDRSDSLSAEDSEEEESRISELLESSRLPRLTDDLPLARPEPSAPRTQPQTLPPTQASPSAPCNVIVNGTGRRPLLTPPPPLPEPCLDRRGGPLRAGGGDAGAGGKESLANNGELEREALKENSCSGAEREPGRRVSAEEEEEAAVEGKPDGGLEEEEGGEHAYALPLVPPAAGCVLIQPSDRTAILSCSISAPVQARGSPELEPPLKRRCLRIRNQNK